MAASLKWRAPYHKMRRTFASQGNWSMASDGPHWMGTLEPQSA